MVARPAGVRFGSIELLYRRIALTKKSWVHIDIEEGASMGLLDSLTSNVLGAAADNLGLQQGQGAGLAKAVLDMLQNQQGGLSGLVQAFEQQGLGNVISSWVGTGQNLPISADQLKQVLSGGALSNLAQQAGVSADQGLGALTQLLPQLIDQLTPDGQVPQGGNLLQAGLEMLKKLS